MCFFVQNIRYRPDNVLAELTVCIFEIANGFAICVICVYTRVFHEGCQLRGAGKDPVLIILGHLRFCCCPFVIEIGMCRNVWRIGVEAERTIARIFVKI